MIAGGRISTRINRETVEEVEFHIEMREKEYREQGLDPVEARRMALEHFGAPSAVERKIRRAKEPRGRKGLRLALVLGLVLVAGLAVHLSGVLDPMYRQMSGDYAKRAPWSAIRWQGPHPQVRLQDKWYNLRQIEGVDAYDVVLFCQATWPQIWKKRFEEDLVEAMTRMGIPPPDAVLLCVEDATAGGVTLVPDVPMTEANRLAIWRAGRNGEMR